MENNNLDNLLVYVYTHILNNIDEIKENYGDKIDMNNSCIKKILDDPIDKNDENYKNKYIATSMSLSIILKYMLI